MKHLVFYSGGIGSWGAAKRVAQTCSLEDLILHFTDTLTEDEDLYRVLIESAAELFGITDIKDLVDRCKDIPPIWEPDKRKPYLMELADDTRERIPNLEWLYDGRDVWDIFFHKRYLGNSRQANCSHILKQELSEKWIKAHYQPDEVTLYLGMDWTETHRHEAPVEHWKPYTVKYPMNEEPLLMKEEMLAGMAEVGIEIPKLYKMGFSHNNCGAFCVRAGQAHFAKLYEEMPERFLYHEKQEAKIREHLEKDVTILRKQKDNVRFRYTLKQLREDLEASKEIDRNDVGGCGCFVDYGGRDNE